MAQEGWSPAPLEAELGCQGLGQRGWKEKWLVGESPVAIVCFCSLGVGIGVGVGGATRGDKASGQPGL